MNVFSKLSLIGAACVLIATVAVGATVSNLPSVEQVNFALNPQPLPPFVGPDEDFAFDRG